MSTVIVKPGICGLESKIVVTKKDNDQDSYLVEIRIESESDNIKRLAKELKEVNGLEECFNNFSTSLVYKLSSKCGLHLACPVPSAIIKAIEVECNLALPRDVEMTISK
ncbi:hypothetical protein GC105_11925 [Alkalibaculum sp. M08DMB]|uniref:Uncharacterized protein n=1 Tax=Alkalibaculum sporogenes TaxID=2655001 RepID=A0A6A7KAC8_9FIRM|nr:hypothetical protein [Alkalibaculum sporogenes]MPW26499.1 hypothetical protein [Alkalibaculum sporogenes]